MVRFKSTLAVYAAIFSVFASVAFAADFDCSGIKDHDQAVAFIGGQGSCAQAASVYRGCSRIWQSSSELVDAALEACERTFYDRLSDKQQEKYTAIAEDCAVKALSPETMKIFWPAVRECRVAAAETWARRHAPQAKPSFDCRKAGSIAEKAICADLALADLDREMAAAYGKARKRVAKEKRLSSALMSDQKAFLANRDALIENRADLAPGTSEALRANYDVGGLMRARITLLGRMLGKPRVGFTGVWGGADGIVEISVSGDVFTVRMKAGRETLEPTAAEDWMCAFAADGGLRGGEIYATFPDWDGVVLVGSDGFLLLVDVTDKEGGELGHKDAPPPFCKRNRTFRPGILLPLAGE